VEIFLSRRPNTCSGGCLPAFTVLLRALNRAEKLVGTRALNLRRPVLRRLAKGCAATPLTAFMLRVLFAAVCVGVGTIAFARTLPSLLLLPCLPAPE
jgi:hypothetical protein